MTELEKCPACGSFLCATYAGLTTINRACTLRVFTGEPRRWQLCALELLGKSMRAIDESRRKSLLGQRERLSPSMRQPHLVADLFVVLRPYERPRKKARGVRPLLIARDSSEEYFSSDECTVKISVTCERLAVRANSVQGARFVAHADLLSAQDPDTVPPHHSAPLYRLWLATALGKLQDIAQTARMFELVDGLHRFEWSLVR